MEHGDVTQQALGECQSGKSALRSSCCVRCGPWAGPCVRTAYLTVPGWLYYDPYNKLP